MPQRMTPDEWIAERVKALNAKAAGGWDPFDDDCAPDDVEELRRRRDELAGDVREDR